MRAKQVERIVSGREQRDPVGVFLTSLVQDLRDVARAEVPSSVAARHLLKMRLATESAEDGPEPVLESEVVAFAAAPREARRRPPIALVGLAAAVVLAMGLSAAITVPRDAATRAGQIRSDVPPGRSVTGSDAADPSVPKGAPAGESGRPVQGGETTVGNTAGLAADQQVSAPATAPVSAGSIGSEPSVHGARGTATDSGGSDGANSGSGTDTGSGDNPTGSGTDGTTEPGKREARGRGSGGDGGGKSGGRKGGGGDRGDGPRAAEQKSKGSGKKAGH